MRKSQYNIYVINDKSVILFNTFTDSMLLVSKSYYKSFQELRFVQGKLSSVDMETFSSLIENGFIIDDERDEFKELSLIHRKRIFENDSYSLTILPTLDCNLRCWYCFENHRVGTRMDEVVQDKICNLAKRVLSDEHVKCLKLELFGGEPLLHFEKDVYPMLKILQKLVYEKGKELLLLIVTNGVCLTKDVVGLLSEFDKVNIQISIDGNREKHNKVKFLSNTKEGTFDVVLNNIKYAAYALDNLFVNLRLNYDDHTLSNVSYLISEIQDIDRKKLEIHLERVWQTKAMKSSNNVLKELLNCFMKNGFNVSYANFNRRNFSCRTDKLAQSVISYDGKVYKCTGRDFDEKMEEGVLMENGEIRWDDVKLARRLGMESFANDKCGACKLLPLCWGPCSQHCMEQDRDDIEQKCYLDKLELSFDDFIRYKFNNYYLSENRK